MTLRDKSRNYHSWYSVTQLARVVLWSILRNDGHHLTCNLCCPVGRLQWWRVIESTAETVRLSISAIIRRRRALSRHTHTNPVDVNIIGSILPHPRTTSPTAPAAEARLRLLLYTEMGEAGNLIRLHFIWFITSLIAEMITYMRRFNDTAGDFLKETHYRLNQHDKVVLLWLEKNAMRKNYYS